MSEFSGVICGLSLVKDLFSSSSLRPEAMDVGGGSWVANASSSSSNSSSSSGGLAEPCEGTWGNWWYLLLPCGTIVLLFTCIKQAWLTRQRRRARRRDSRGCPPKDDAPNQRAAKADNAGPPPWSWLPALGLAMRQHDKCRGSAPRLPLAGALCCLVGGAVSALLLYFRCSHASAPVQQPRRSSTAAYKGGKGNPHTGAHTAADSAADIHGPLYPAPARNSSLDDGEAAPPLPTTTAKVGSTAAPVHDSVLSTGGDTRVPRGVPSQRAARQDDSGRNTPAAGGRACVIDGRELQLLQQIGAGSHGVVRLGTWNSAAVAVKMLADVRLGDADDPAARALHKEIKLMQRLRHPNLLQYVGLCLHPLALVTEYCPRGSLLRVLREGWRPPHAPQVLSWKRRLLMAIDVAQGMEYLHQRGVLHRDLRSPNLLVCSNYEVKVGDFGLSTLLREGGQQSSLADTNPRYLAPEVVRGGAPSTASDVYAFGVVLWELLTMQEPFEDHSPMQVVYSVAVMHKRPEIPPPTALPGGPFAGLPALLDLMQRCWADDVAVRPDFTAVNAALRGIALGMAA